jgi:hypothetical protein
MNIVTEIKAIAEAVNPTGTVTQLTSFEQNVKADNDDMPVIYFEVVKEQNINRAGAMFKKWQLSMLFATISDLADYTNDSPRVTFQDAMNELCDDFYKQTGLATDSLDRRLFRQVTALERRSVTNWGDVNLSGIFLSVELEELLPYARC